MQYRHARRKLRPESREPCLGSLGLTPAARNTLPATACARTAEPSPTRRLGHTEANLRSALLSRRLRTVWPYPKHLDEPRLPNGGGHNDKLVQAIAIQVLDLKVADPSLGELR